MVAQFFKKNALIAVALMFALSLDAKKTKKIQVLVNPGDSGFIFYGNNGDGTIGDNVFAPRVAGGSYTLNGLIYPSGTIDREDEDCFFSDEDSIGTFYCEANLLSDLAFDNEGGFPAEGTAVELVTWYFNFNEECDGQANNLIAFGTVHSGQFAPDAIGFSGAGMPVLGSKCNDDLNFIKSARAYFNNFENCEAAPQILIEIEFEDKIEYRD